MKNKKHVQLNTIKEDVEALDINTAIEVESSINTYLRRSSETFDLTKNYEVIFMTKYCLLKDNYNILYRFIMSCFHYKTLFSNRRYACNYGQPYMITQA